MMRFNFYTGWLLLFGMVNSTHAATLLLPNNGDNIITKYINDLPLTRSEQDETLLDVARRFLIGQNEIVRLNQDMDRWHVKKGEIVRLPNKYILPDTPHNGITLNLPEFRMYVYSRNASEAVMTFANSIGADIQKIPLGKTSIVRKVPNNNGPHNSRGAYTLYLDLPGKKSIHGIDIDLIFGIGMQLGDNVAGMYPEDIENLYNAVSPGTPVYIVNQPIKVGWLDNVLYVEALPDLDGHMMTKDERYALALRMIGSINGGELPNFDQSQLNEALTKLDGDPVAIYKKLMASEPNTQTIANTVPVTNVTSPVTTPITQIARKDSRLALIIGNSDYVNKLANPVRDAESVKNELAKLGFDVMYYPDVTNKEDMEHRVDEFAEQLKGKEIALFYYSGHGVQHNGENYLMPTQAAIEQARQIKYRAMNLNYLMDAVRATNTELNIVILDACRNDPYPRDERSSLRGLARIEAPSSTIIAYSTSPGKTADDGEGKHSPYTKALLYQLQQYADKPINELLNDVSIAVEDDTQKQQSPRLEQSPLRKKFCFAEGSSCR